MSEIFGNSIMGGGGLTNSKLALADAQSGDVRSGKKFYSGDKQLKTGTVNDVIPSPIIMKLDPEGKVTATVQPEEGFISTEKRTETLGLPTQSAGTVTPNISEQVAVHRGVYTVGDVKVAAVNGIIRVTFPNGSTCTCSNGSTTLTAAGGGTATFLVPTTGTWTLSATDGTLTAAKTVDITETMRSANIELSFFSATISITYPAASTCVITDSNGTTVASDTNADSAAKTWTATVGATGTYTVTATATDGSGKSKSTTVSITAEGQVATVTLMYVFYMFKENEGIGPGLSLKGINYFTSGAITNSDLPYSPSAGFSVTKECISANQKNTGNSYWISEKIDVSNYKTLKLDLVCSDRYDDTYSISFGVGPDVPSSQSSIGTYTASKTGIYNTQRGVQSVDISNVNGEVYLKIKGYAVVHKIYNWWLE